MSLRKHPTTCINCKKDKQQSSSSSGKFCSNKCQQEYQFNERYQKWLDGTPMKSHRWLRKAFAVKDGAKCSCCMISEWCGKRIVLEVEHKDGNSDNNSVENLCLLCPNYHSQTETYKGANRGNGRHSRRERYKLGLSY